MGEEVCGTMRIKKEREERGMRKLRVFERKKKCFSVWRRTGRDDYLEKYRRRKEMVQQVKKKTKEEQRVSIAENFKENNKCCEEEYFQDVDSGE